MNKTKIRFKAKLFRPAESDKGDDWTFLILPPNASAKLPSRGMTSVEGTFNGLAFRATLEPDGQGGHWLKVDRKLREAAGAEAGDVVSMEIAPRGRPASIADTNSPNNCLERKRAKKKRPIKPSDSVPSRRPHRRARPRSFKDLRTVCLCCPQRTRGGLAPARAGDSPKHARGKGQTAPGESVTPPDRYFPATILGGHLHVRGIPDWGPWDPARLEWQGETFVDMILSPDHGRPQGRDARGVGGGDEGAAGGGAHTVYLDARDWWTMVEAAGIEPASADPGDSLKPLEDTDSRDSR